MLATESRIAVAWAHLRRFAHRGITLIELLIGVAIVGILGMVALPAYRSYVDGVRLNAAIADIRLIETRNRPHRGVEELDLRGERIAEEPRYSKSDIDSRPVDEIERQYFKPGDATRCAIPLGPDPK